MAIDTVTLLEATEEDAGAGKTAQFFFFYYFEEVKIFVYVMRLGMDSTFSFNNM